MLAACRRVNDRNGVAGVIGLHHCARLVAVAIPRADPGLERPVALAEPRVAVAVWVARAVFFPKQ
jgi:hypothetical protein